MNNTKNNENALDARNEFLQAEPVEVEETELLSIAGGRMCPKLTSIDSCTV